ncbi:glycoside hydrolase family 47 protein [Mycena belliarum]|uniref:alpha-1,2-Mannosidase n=1 Tax=Mycena belliarum TaxID=1033014 RepID=A0AAD6TPN0_9AGAR|nr:glycoside hydrolase family 47 protein [Mycena belliae]
MLPSPSSASPPPRGGFSLALLTRNLFGRLSRWWHLCLVLIVILWLSGSAFTPRRYRIQFFKSSRPAGGPRPPPVRLPAEGDLWAGRAHDVRKAFMHAYKGYQAHALPSDELRPMTGEQINNFHGWGVTMYDSLDTMWLMGLEDMFYDTVQDVAKATFSMAPGEHAHFFEVVIRYLGGLLSAYALSEDPRLLKLADDLGEKLLPAFDTPSGFPVYGVNTATGETIHGARDGEMVCLAEVFSNQMEFKYLAHITGKSKYYKATERPMRAVYGTENTMHDGLLATMWDVNTGKPNQTHFSASGRADSAYEYFLKQWLMTGQKVSKARDLYIRSANAILEHLLYVGPHRELLYVTDLKDGAPTHHFEHLACFLPGLLALGVHTPALGLTAGERERHTWAAHGLANLCAVVYSDTVTGLSPDNFVVDRWAEVERGLWASRVDVWERAGRVGPPPGTADLPREAATEARGYSPVTDAYLLRPEAVETFYIMWRTTGDVKWRERGWAVFVSLETYSRVKYGYTSIRYLDERRPYRFDDMPSWFLAETLKYLFLLFTDEELVPLDKWVFNTEAHPLPVFEWSQEEIQEFDIDVA